MPEGHVIHRLANELNRTFAGERVRVQSPQGRFAESAALLDGHVLSRAEAHGKNLFVRFASPHGATALDVAQRPAPDPADDQVVHIHLGLIGKLYLRPLAPVQGTVRLRIDDARTAADLYGPQTCALITVAEMDAVRARLGPDPLRPDADPDVAWQRVHRSGRSIASLLMDQRIAAGVGNIYRCEVLFRHRIDPTTPGNRLKHATWNLLWDDLADLMPLGVSDGRIDTVRPDHTPEAMGRDPRVDRHGGEVYVYRRAHMPCHVCGREIRTADLEGRHLYWCATCQRRHS